MALDEHGGGGRGGGGGSTIRVVALRTGLSMETLRAWERRYGFPAPSRREGSNRRLYSEADVERLHAITRALARGYRIGDVVERSPQELDALGGPEPERERPAKAPAERIEHLVTLLAQDRITEVEEHLRHAALEAGPRRFVTETAHPLLVRIGEAWRDGRLSVRHEHLATACLEAQLAHLLTTFQDVRSAPHVLLATLPGEAHVLALRMVALFLAVNGAQARVVGGGTPVGELAASARGLAADVVGLTVTSCADRARTKKEVRALREALPRGVALWVGGAGAQALGLAQGGVRIVDSWAGIEAAVNERRARARAGA